MKPEWHNIISKLSEEGIEKNVIIKVLSEERKHSDFSASGSERWLNCPGSVALSRKRPKSPDNFWSVGGSVGHYYLELWLKNFIKTGNIKQVPKSLLKAKNVYRAVKKAVEIVAENWDRESELLQLETRVSLEYIYEGVFGTGDIRIYDPIFRRLKIYDYKQGQSLVETEYNNRGIRNFNTQLMFYALGSAYEIGFDKIDEIEIGVIQPNVGHADGVFRVSVFGIETLKTYETFFRKGIERALKPNAKVFAGKWCHWCTAKDICPVQEKVEIEKAASYF